MKSLFIKNFKNIEELKIDSLSRVNLIAGRNNVGKSTLLEAISIYASGGSFDWLRELLEMRGEYTRSTYREDDRNAIEKFRKIFASLFYGRKAEFNEEKQIIIASCDTNSDDIRRDFVTLQFVYLKETSETDESGNIRTKKEIIKNNKEINQASKTKEGIELEVRKSGIVFTISESYKDIQDYNFDYGNFGFTNFFIDCQLIKTNAAAREENATLWDKVVMTEKENDVVEALQIIDPSIEKLSFIDEDSQGKRIPVVKLKDSDTRLRLSSMGDGINRVLTIILGLVNCKNGFLLIDEFENGLHYTVQTKLWEIIFKLSEKLNIQVFVTTHSRDCISSFAKVNKDDAGQIIRLENRKGKIVPVTYDEKEISIIADSDIEIR